MKCRELMVGYEWVVGYENLYAISDKGDVYSYRSHKYLKPHPNHRGYLMVDLYNEFGARKKGIIHRLVAEAFIHNPDNKPEVDHKNGIKTDNRASNLEWVTPSENQIHSVQTNLKKHGTDLWNGKFTKEQVIEIIVRKHKGESCRKLGKEFGCDQTTISAISRGLRYRQYFVKGELQHALRLCGLNELADNFKV